MKLIVGLGNPGFKYAATRHNVGFQVVERFAEKYRISLDTHEKDALTGRGRVAGGSVMAAKPLTYMNLSGSAVGKLVRAYLDSPRDLIVVYDDVDLPLGKLRLRERGSTGTHNGMRSIVSELGTEDFPRLRFGIRGEPAANVDLADYVLGEFELSEMETIEPAIVRSLDALLMFCRGDLKRAMTQFNKDPEPPNPPAAETTNGTTDHPR
jgi:PTH1 family peptidyl-tRNA hydrolase